MSRVGKQPIALPSSVNFDYSSGVISLSGPKGKLSHKVPSEVILQKVDNHILLTINDKTCNKSKALWGLTRSLVSNMVKGVGEGFKTILDINGVGYRAAVKGDILTLFLGFSHEIKYLIPAGVQIICPKPTQIEVLGFDKEVVGQVAANIRQLRKPEPYKGKGIKYQNEVIYRKEGKKK
jgi:large subunit ribosomal protein L6